MRPWLAGITAGAMLLAGCTATPPGAIPGAGTADSPGLAAAATRAIGFATVADAHTALAARTDVQRTVRGTYEVFADAPARAIWLFTLPGSAAYPALVRRQLVDTAGGVVMTSSVFCEAAPAVCSLLQENTRLLDAALVEEMSHPSPGSPDTVPAPPRPPPIQASPGLRT